MKKMFAMSLILASALAISASAEDGKTALAPSLDLAALLEDGGR